MLQRIIKSETILLAPVRALLFTDFNRQVRVKIFESHKRTKLSLLRDLHKNEFKIKKIYIWRGFSEGLEEALGLNKKEDVK